MKLSAGTLTSKKIAVVGVIIMVHVERQLLHIEWEYLICMYTSIEAGLGDEGFCNIFRIKMVTGAASL